MAALEATALATALRGSVWAYPLVNAAHIFGVALLVGAIVPLDLRLLGAWRSVPLTPLWQMLTITAGAGIGLAIATGLLLFMTRATEYAASSLFISKMMVVGVGVINALILLITMPGEGSRMGSPEKLPGYVRLAAAISLVSWLTTLILGRLIGYF